jgi:hypothetical protein
MLYFLNIQFINNWMSNHEWSIYLAILIFCSILGIILFKISSSISNDQ